MKLTHKVLLLLIVSIVGTFSATTVFELSKLRQEFAQQHESAHKIILTNLMSNLAGAMFNIDERRIRSQVISSFEFGDITSILLIDDKAKISAYLKREQGKPELTEADSRDMQAWPEDVLEKFREPAVAYNEVTLDMIKDLGIVKPAVHRYQATLWYVDDDRQTFVGHIIFDFSTAQIARKVEQAALAKIVSAAAIASILLFGIFFFLKVSVLSRLESLKSAANKIKQRDFTTRIVVSGNDEIAVLGGTFQSMADEIQSYQIDLENKVKVRTRELQESRDKIKMVFDTIDQGIVSFDNDYRVDAEFSKKTLDILGVQESDLLQNGINTCLIQRLDLSADRKDQIHAVVNSIIESDELAFEGNEVHLPREAAMTDFSGMKRYFRLQWYPIVDQESDLTSSLLLSITDLTREKEEEEQKRQLSARNQRLITLVAASQTHHLGTLRRFLEHGPKDLQAVSRHGKSDNALITLHTLKGEARTLGLSDLSSMMHETETALKERDEEAVRASLRLALDVFASYQSIFEQTFQSEKNTRGSFVQCATRLYQSVNERLQGVGRKLAGFEIVDNYVAWDKNFLEQVLSPCLMHAVNNSLDHGFLLPEEKYGESRPIFLSLRARPSDFGFVVEIADRGYGINEDAIMQRAKAIGINTHALRADEILFLPEFSTSEQVSMTSGRGVGMAAIKQIVEKHQGRVKLQSRFKEGTTLTLEFPQSQQQVLTKAG